jgi:hypothetical protein
VIFTQGITPAWSSKAIVFFKMGHIHSHIPIQKSNYQMGILAGVGEKTKHPWDFHKHFIPYAPCMEYLPTFALKITQFCR